MVTSGRARSGFAAAKSSESAGLPGDFPGHRKNVGYAKAGRSHQCVHNRFRMLSTILSLREAKPTASWASHLFRQGWLDLTREAESFRVVPTWQQVQIEAHLGVGTKIEAPPLKYANNVTLRQTF